MCVTVLAVGGCKGKTSEGGKGGRASEAPASSASRATSESPSVDPSAPKEGDAFVHRAVTPSATDSAIHEPNDPHEVFVPSGTKNGKLLVYMPGTNNKPAGASLFLMTAARAGYHTIGLSYPDHEPATACKTDLHCFETFRRRVWDGSNVSDKVEVSVTDSIKNRLVKLLTHLEAQFPNEGWKAYLAGDDLAYSSIAFSGHSQGGGFAAFIAKNHEVARVLMFSSVVDASEGTPPVPAHWVSGNHVTPVERYYGFDHVNDKFAHKIAVDWVALGLDKLGPRFSVDGQKAPYGNSHQLTTAIPEPDGQKAHGSVLPDHGTPVNDSVPLFQDVWRYMLLH